MTTRAHTCTQYFTAVLQVQLALTSVSTYAEKETLILVILKKKAPIKYNLQFSSTDANRCIG